MKDYNMQAHLGIKDQDYVEEFGMPAELAGTPEMNNWVMNMVYDGNVEADTKAFIEEGMDPSKAGHTAKQNAKKALGKAKANLKKVTKARGY